MAITEPKVESYIYDMLPARHPVQVEMEKYAKRNSLPIVGPLVGRILFQLAIVSNAQRILEAGIAIGYSTSWWAMAAKANGGRVTAVEIEPSFAEIAKKNLKAMGLDHVVDVEVGDAAQVISKLNGPFDIVFIDAEKEEYLNIFEAAAPKLRAGGILLADNALWGGRVATNDRSEATLAVKKFNETIFGRKDFEGVILPVRDGVAFAVKKG